MFSDGIVNVLNRLSKLGLALVPDILVIGGAVAAIWGVHLWSVPLAYVVGGVLAIFLGIATVRKV